MSKLYKVIHNATTDEIETLELDGAELAQLEADKAQLQIELEAQAQKAADKATLLAKLGISEAEAKLLLS
jgi:hypothetical protein